MSGDFPLYFQDAWRVARAANRPLANQVGLHYGLLAAVFALVQVIVSNTTTANYQGPLIALQQANNPAAGATPIETLLPPLIVGALSAIIGGFLMLIFSALAAATTAHLTRDAGLGQRAALITAAVSGITWTIFGGIGAVIGGTDGFFLVVNPFSTQSIASQVSGIALIAVARGAVIGALSLLPAWFCGTLGAQAGMARR
jgi:hypothetical protein